MPRNDIEIALLGADERHDAVAATSRAFWPDPLFGFFSRDPIHEHRSLPAFLAVILDDARRHGEVWVARHDGRAVASASWLPPGSMPRSRGREARIYLGSVGTILLGRNRRLALRLFEEIERRHPAEPHWYLALLGVDPKWQGRGLGGALLEPVLGRCDEDGRPAYLETQKPENVAFYRRVGFEVLDEVHLDGAPPVWLLWRDPRPPGG